MPILYLWQAGENATGVDYLKWVTTKRDIQLTFLSLWIFPDDVFDSNL